MTYLVVLLVIFSRMSSANSIDMCTETSLDPCTCPSGSQQIKSSNHVFVCELCEAGKFQAEIGSGPCSSCTGKTKSNIGDIKCTDCVDSFITSNYNHKECLACPWTINDVNFINVRHFRGGSTKSPYNRSHFYIDRHKCTTSSQPMNEVSDFLSGRKQCSIGQSSQNIQDDSKDTVCVNCPFGKFNSETRQESVCVNITECTRGSTDVSLSFLATEARHEDTNCHSDIDAQEISAGNYPILADNAFFRFDQHRNSRIVGYVQCVQETQRINCDIAESCVDSFMISWETGRILLGELVCQKVCSAGFSMVESKCRECQPGTSKNLPGNTGCADCEAGKYNNIAKSLVCQECPDWHFSKTHTLCAPCCQTNKKYVAGSDCYQPDHYIVKNACLDNKHAINLMKCDQSTSALAQHPTDFQWTVEGIEYCTRFVMSRVNCGTKSYYDGTQCVECLTHDSPIKMQYFNRMCGTTRAGVYMASSCSNNLNTMCMHCPNYPNLMVLDTANIPDDNVTESAQCKYRCKSRDGTFYVKTLGQTADMLQMSVSDLKQVLSIGWSNSICIKSTVDSRLLCMTRNMELVDTRDVSPQIQCVPVELSCLSKNGVLVKNLNVGSIECHCRSGFYGTYDTLDSHTLVECQMCPPYMTSITGTKNRNACFCQSGYYHDDDSQNSDICFQCGHPAHYCPGGLDIATFDSSGIVNSEEKSNELAEKYKLGRNRLLCPTYTSVKTNIAKNKMECVATDNVKFDTKTRTYIKCDVQPYISAIFTKWLPSVDGLLCQRECVFPSTRQNSDGNCRCDSNAGYRFSNESQTCQCKPGYFLLDDVCTICPPNSYCPGGTAQNILCRGDSLSDVGSDNVGQCYCFDGFAKESQFAMCLRCKVRFKCYRSISNPCTLDEQCFQRNLYKPIGCEAGTYRFSQNSQDICRVFKYGVKTPVLYSNRVQYDRLHVKFEVMNPMLAYVMSTSVYSEFTIRAQTHVVQITGFLSHFEFLCPNEHVFSLGNTSNIDDMQVSCVDSKSLFPLQNVFLINPTDNVLSMDIVRFGIMASRSYKHPFLNLLIPENHLTWHVFFTCMKPFDISNNNKVSEMGETCTACESGHDEAFIQLTAVADYKILKRSASVKYILKTFYVTMDTATQYVWSGKPTSRSIALLEISYQSISQEQNEVTIRVVSTDIDSGYKEFSEQKKLKYTLSRFHNQQRIIFGLHVPVAGYKMEYNKIVFAGVCQQEIPDQLMLLVFHLHDDIVSAISLADCDGCCDASNTFENSGAFYDVAVNTLFISTSNMIYYTYFSASMSLRKLDADFTGIYSNVFFMSQTAIKSPQIPFLSNNALALQCLSGPIVFFVLQQSDPLLCSSSIQYCFSFDTIPSDINMGTLTATTSTQHVQYFSNSMVLQKLRLERDSRHFPGIQQVEPDEFYLNSFSVMNNRKWNTTSWSAAPGRPSKLKERHAFDVVLLHVGERSTSSTIYELIVSRVHVDGGVITVELLATLFQNTVLQLSLFFYSIIPYAAHATHSNNILAKSVVGLMYQEGDLFQLFLYNFSCFSCTSAISEKSAAHHNCPCIKGTAPVCIPCGSECNINTYIAGTGVPDDKCIKADVRNVNNKQKYNFYCLPCAGGAFCRDGTVSGISVCPSDIPYAANSYSSSVSDCVCAVGRTFSTVSEFSGLDSSMQKKTVNGSRLELNSLCRNCSDNELCSPIYTAQHSIRQCPPNTRYYSYIGTPTGEGGETYTIQKCQCDSGFYRHNASFETYKIQNNMFPHIFTFNNDSVFFNTRERTREKFWIEIEKCAPCEVGFFCENSQQQACPAHSTTLSRMSATRLSCACFPGYSPNTPSRCGACAIGDICSGQVDFKRVDCHEHQFCPCPPGHTYNQQKRVCEDCSAGFYCAGFSQENLTGIDPRDFIHLSKCPPNSTSLSKSTRVQNCTCRSGWFMNINLECQQCPIGHYCVESKPMQCPLFMTTLMLGSSSKTECLCRTQGYERNEQDQCICDNGRLLDNTTQTCVSCPHSPASISIENTCVCAPGFFNNSRINRLIFQNQSKLEILSQHPLSSDYRQTMQLYKDIYQQFLSLDTEVENRCIPCPPTASCVGNNQIIQYVQSVLSRYIPMSCAVSDSELWSLPCPVDNAANMYLRATSIGMSSCFSSGQTFTPYQEDSSFILSTYTFPVLLVAKLYDNTSDFIYSLVSRNSTFYNNVIFANSMIAPTIKSVHDNNVLGDSYIFLVSMNRVQVSVEFSYKMYKQQYRLHAELAPIDYGTGIAYNSIIPILWACSVSEKLMNPAIRAVFVVDGIVDNTFVRKIIEKTISIVMRVFEIQVSRPEYIFQASSAQFYLGSNDLQYIHRNLCDGFQGNNDFACLAKIKGSFISTYKIHQITQSIHLHHAETLVKTDFNLELSQFIGLNHLQIRPTKKYICPFATVQQVDMSTETSITCFICGSSKFFRNGICMPCIPISSMLCSRPFLIKSCSWLDNNKCSVSFPD